MKYTEVLSPLQFRSLKVVKADEFGGVSGGLGKFLGKNKDSYALPATIVEYLISPLGLVTIV